MTGSVTGKEQGRHREILCTTEGAVARSWTLSVDGAANMRGTGLGIVLRTPTGDVLRQAIRCDFKVTNNEAEYEAIILGMRIARELGAKNLEVKCDSQLVARQMDGTYEARCERMQAYLNKAMEEGAESHFTDR